jgi:hypothetical protein
VAGYGLSRDGVGGGDELKLGDFLKSGSRDERYDGAAGRLRFGLVLGMLVLSKVLSVCTDNLLVITS